MKSGFIEIFQAMNPDERRAFIRYIHSFYGSQKIAIRALEFIKEEISKGRPIDEEELSFRTYPHLGERYINKHIQNTLSDLKGYVYEFIIWLEIKSNQKDHPLVLIKWLQDKKLFLAEQQQINKAKKNFEQSWDDSFWQRSAEYHLHHYLYFNAANETLSNQSDNLSIAWKSLDRFYFTTKLIYTCEVLNRGQILGSDHAPHIEDSEIEKILDAIKKWEYDETIRIYKEILILVTTNTLDSFNKLRSYVDEPHSIKSSENFKSVILYALNFATKALRDGRAEMDYESELLRLYKIGLSSNVFLTNGFIAPNTFQSIVNLSCSLGEALWANQFIEEWSNFLNPEMDSNEDLIKISLARVRFALKEFDRALDLVPFTSRPGTSLEIQSRALEVMCYYEIQSDLLPYKLDSLSMYLYRLRGRHHPLNEGMINFLNILKSMYNNNSYSRSRGMRSKKTNQLLEKLDQARPIAFKKWLYEKIQEMT